MEKIKKTYVSTKKHFRQLVTKCINLIKRESTKLVLIISYLGLLISFYIVSGRFWFWNIFSILPPILFLCISIILIAYSIYKLLTQQNLTKKLRVTFLVVAFFSFLVSLNLSEINISAINNRREVQIDDSINLFDWNTEFWDAFDNENEFYKFLKDQDADIYHLQERILQSPAFGVDIADDSELLEHEFGEYKIITSGELVTITKFEVVQVKRLKDAKILRVDMKINDRVISFYNVHIPVHINVLINSPFQFIADIKDRYEWREDEFAKLKEDLELNVNPIVISGDFNTTKLMNRMDYFKKYFDSQKASKNLFPATWQLFGIKAWRIDYVFIDDRIKAIKHTDVNPKGLSDHWGISVFLNI